MTSPLPANPTYRGAEDVYRELVEESQQSWLLGLLAFAVVEEQRIEWMRHYEKVQGALPSADLVRGWYESQPPGVLLRARGTAENALLAYSEEVTAELDKDFREDIQNGVIVGEIRDLKRFWPQFGVNVAGGLASAVLFAAILTLVAFLVLNDTSPVEIVKKSSPATEGAKDGK
ncbi:hypothetical protein [Methyloversatilis sp. NSM2]|uniref:hypothetical protein n=1 Tax=Methyloversatilis sp. NSM2 TaxID=3134135 RepID=UPI003115D326